MMCELCSIKDFIVHWDLPLLCLFGLRNFETIQYALCPDRQADSYIITPPPQTTFAGGIIKITLKNDKVQIIVEKNLITQIYQENKRLF
jgi:hypothetical protein